MWTVVSTENIELSGTTAVGFTAGSIRPTDSPSTQAALCQLGTAAAITVCGATPTYQNASSGILTEPRSVFIITGLEDLRTFKIVKFQATNTSLFVQYLR